jgi:hypothetical protein
MLRWCVASTAAFSLRAPCPKKTGPKGPSEALIRIILELKSRNPRFGSPRIARIISHTFGVDIDKNVVHRVLAKHYRPTSGGTGTSSSSQQPPDNEFETHRPEIDDFRPVFLGELGLALAAA